MNSPSSIVQFLLVTDGHANDPEDTASGDSWPCFIEHFPDAPDNALCVHDTLPTKDGRYHRTGEVLERPSVQITLRSEEYEVGYALMVQIKEALDTVLRRTVVIGSDTYKIHAFTRGAGIMSLGQESGTTKRRQLFTLNYLFTLNQ